jgi:hypothetical protein
VHAGVDAPENGQPSPHHASCEVETAMWLATFGRSLLLVAQCTSHAAVFMPLLRFALQS